MKLLEVVGGYGICNTEIGWGGFASLMAILFGVSCS